MKRRGVTFVELMVAFVIASLVIYLLYSALRVLTLAEKSTDRDGMRAITLSRLVEVLQMDLRSSSRVEESGDRIEITRWTFDGDRLADSRVVWTTQQIPGSPPRTLVRREEDGARTQEFDLSELKLATTTAVDLRLEKLADPDEIFGEMRAPGGPERP